MFYRLAKFLTHNTVRRVLTLQLRLETTTAQESSDLRHRLFFTMDGEITRVSFRISALCMFSCL